MRLSLPDGRWADIHDVRTHRIAMAVEKAFSEAAQATKSGEYPPDFMTAEILAYVTAWSEPYPLTVDGLLDAPQDRFFELFEAVNAHDDEVIAAAKLPKGSPSESESSETPTTTDQAST